MGIRRVVVIFPDQANLSSVEQFRSVWDPLSGKVAAHVTLVYPFEGKADDTEVVAAVKAVAARHSPFALELADPVIIDREYLFLVARHGGEQIGCLHAELYDALPGARTEGPFVPHMTIGRIQDPAELDAALRHASLASLRVQGLATAVSIYRIGDGGFRRVQSVVPLGSTTKSQ